jgi:O-succinylbenzoic acid--CoA ligase
LTAIDAAGEQLRLSFEELDAKADRMAQRLAELGIGAGDRVGWIDQMNRQSVELLFGTLRRRATACPLSPRWPDHALAEAQRTAQLRVVWRDAEPSVWSSVNDLAPTQSHATGSSARVSNGDDDDDDDLATILFSSGSTGTPKAIAHDLAAHLASAAGSNENLPLRAGDRWLLSLPLCHVSGLGIVFRCMLAGATIVIPRPDTPLEAQLESLAITHLSLVPTQLLRIVTAHRHPPAALQAVLLGGAPLPGDLIQRAGAAGWPLYTTYGLTEMASQVTATGPRAKAEDLQTCGRLLRGRELKMGADGEIHVRGASLCRGYVQEDRIACPWGADGWFATGDRGQWDEQGRLIVLGRRDNLFISGGENVYPEEIERALMSLPGVRQALVVAVPDQQFGARPVAFVDGEPFAPLQWQAALADRLPRFKIPDRFYPVPPTGGLKPDRHQLRELAIRRLAECE